MKTLLLAALFLAAQSRPSPVGPVEPEPPGYADKGANITLQHVLPLFCVTKDEQGKPQVSLGPTFECVKPAADDKWSCTGIVLKIVKDCEQVRVVHGKAN